MSEQDPDTAKDSMLRQRALSRWDGEGGAGPTGPDMATPLEARVPHITMSDAEMVTLRVRLIALENLMIAFLASATDQQLDLAREIAGYISPRPGFTPHPLTTHAASDMLDLVERSARFSTPDKS